MEIEKAYEVLREYYSQTELDSLYRNKKFDGSESDTIKKHEYNANLLAKKARETKDEEKRQELWSAENTFLNLARKESYNR